MRHTLFPSSLSSDQHGISRQVSGGSLSLEFSTLDSTLKDIQESISTMGDEEEETEEGGGGETEERGGGEKKEGKEEHVLSDDVTDEESDSEEEGTSVFVPHPDSC